MMDFNEAEDVMMRHTTVYGSVSYVRLKKLFNTHP